MLAARSLIAIAFLLSVLVPTAANAENGTYDFFHCFSGTPQTLKHSDSNTSSVVLVNGTLRASEPGTLFDNMSTQCTILFGQTQGTPYARGFCEWLDADGDRMYIEHERVGGEGKSHSVSGTGKYASLSIEATYESMRFPQTPGVVKGCSHVKGRWERR